MNKIEKKLNEGGYSSINSALRAVKLTKADKVTKARLTQLVEDYFATATNPKSHRGIFVDESKVAPIASNRVIVGVERVAAVAYVTAVKNDITLDELFGRVKELVRFWGIDGD